MVPPPTNTKCLPWHRKPSVKKPQHGYPRFLWAEMPALSTQDQVGMSPNQGALGGSVTPESPSSYGQKSPWQGSITLILYPVAWIKHYSDDNKPTAKSEHKLPTKLPQNLFKTSCFDAYDEVHKDRLQEPSALRGAPAGKRFC